MNKYTLSNYFYFLPIMVEFFKSLHSIKLMSYEDVVETLKDKENYEYMIKPEGLAYEGWTEDGDLYIMAGIIKDLAQFDDDDHEYFCKYADSHNNLNVKLVDLVYEKNVNETYC